MEQNHFELFFLAGLLAHLISWRLFAAPTNYGATAALAILTASSTWLYHYLWLNLTSGWYIFRSSFPILHLTLKVGNSVFSRNNTPARHFGPLYLLRRRTRFTWPTNFRAAKVARWPNIGFPFGCFFLTALMPLCPRNLCRMRMRRRKSGSFLYQKNDKIFNHYNRLMSLQKKIRGKKWKIALTFL